MRRRGAHRVASESLDEQGGGEAGAHPGVHASNNTCAPTGGSVPARGESDGVTGLFDFLFREATWGSALRWRQPAAGAAADADSTLNVFHVPYQSSKFILFGQFVAMDLFLFQFTMLPLRILYGLLSVCLCALRGVVSLLSGGGGGLTCTPPTRADHVWLPFTRATLYDLSKGLIVLAATLVLGEIQISRVYHDIRGEAIIKFYVIFNILEVLEKLCACWGTDIIDTLYHIVRNSSDLALLPHIPLYLVQQLRSRSSCDAGARAHPLAAPGAVRAALLAGVRYVAILALAVVYVSVHAGVIFVQVVCLDVALFSKSNALLTLLISNNFVEIKSSVFKRLEPENLFQISCADALERFHLIFYFVVISLRVGWSTQLLLSMLYIYLVEVVIDAIKHSFIGKFNRMKPDQYATFSAFLSSDAISVRSRMATSLDPTHVSVRRLGMATLPLACVVCSTVFSNSLPTSMPRITHPAGILAMVLLLLTLCLVRACLNMLVLARAGRVIAAQQERTKRLPQPAHTALGRTAMNDAAYGSAAASTSAGTQAAPRRAPDAQDVQTEAAAAEGAAFEAALALPPRTPMLAATPLLQAQAKAARYR